MIGGRRKFETGEVSGPRRFLFDMQSTTQITDNIFQVRIPIPFPLVNVNCYLVRDTPGWTMIDTGMHHAPAFEAWDEAFRELGLRAQDLSRIILTHAHPDHYGLAGHFQNLSGAPVFALDEEIRIVPIEWQAGGEHTVALAAFFEKHGAPHVVVEQVAERTMQVLRMLEPQPVLSPLYEGEIIHLGGQESRVIWTPGHADGHLLLHQEQDGVLFAGDQILAKITPNIALWPGLDPNPLKSYLSSLGKLEHLNTVVALTGHRAVIHDVPGRVAELREHHRNRLQQCIEAVDGDCNGYQVCLKIFPRLESVDDIRMAMVETLSHLEYLVSEGRLERTEDTIIRYRQA